MILFGFYSYFIKKSLVIALQDMGLLLSCQYADHHKPPFNNNYCIVSGLWNKFLDKQHVFKALETTLFFKLGVRPRSWSEPNSDWTKETKAPKWKKTHICLYSLGVGLKRFV